MTIENYILGRSYLPKTGVFTIKDHLIAMLMEIYGTTTSLKTVEQTVKIQVLESKAIIKVKQSILAIEVNMQNNSITVSDDNVNIRIR